MRHSKIADGRRFRGKSGRAADITGMTEFDPQADIGPARRDRNPAVQRSPAPPWWATVGLDSGATRRPLDSEQPGPNPESPYARARVGRFRKRPLYSTRGR